MALLEYMIIWYKIQVIIYPLLYYKSTYLSISKTVTSSLLLVPYLNVMTSGCFFLLVILTMVDRWCEEEGTTLINRFYSIRKINMKKSKKNNKITASLSCRNNNSVMVLSHFSVNINLIYALRPSSNYLFSLQI